MFALFDGVIAFLIFAALSYLGCWLSARQLRIGKWLLAATAVLGAICSGFAYVSMLYPGPDSRYLAGSREAFIREWIMAPTITTVAYFLRRLFTEKSSGTCLAVTLLNLICAVLYLPVILFGLTMHAAHVAGAWL